MFAEIKNIKTGKKDLRSFGITIGIILLIISGFLFFKNNDSYQILSYIATSFIGLGFLLPFFLKPIYLIWMTFSVILGWIMTRVILMILFFLIITPIGLFAKIFGKDFLDLNKSNHGSYWNSRISKLELNQDYEKQY